MPEARRLLELDSEGLLHVKAPGLEPMVITPCLLPVGAVGELAAAIQGSSAPDPQDGSQRTTPVHGGPQCRRWPAPVLGPASDSFGSLRVSNHAGEAVSQPGQRQRSTQEALAYLASHPGWVRKDALRAALFPTGTTATIPKSCTTRSRRPGGG